MIYIKNSYITTSEKSSRIHFLFIDNNIEKELWLETSSENSDYLCYERADAAVIAMLQYAMITSQDIVTEIPMTEDILRNLEMLFIPSLSNNSAIYKRIHIKAPIANNIKDEKNIIETGVGTGCSCGVDSFYSIANNINNPYPNFKLTHLFVTDVGAFSDAMPEFNNTELFDDTVRKAELVAKELRLKLITSKTNYFELFDENFLYTVTYANMFAVYCFQKLFSVYYFSSSVDFSHFELINCNDVPSMNYDLLTLFCISSSKLTIIPEGSQVTRFEKTKSIKDFHPAKKYLSVCSKNIKNCGICHKCKRTLLDLDANNALENFKRVFNLNEYKKNRDIYYKELLSNSNSPFSQNAAKEIAKRINVKYINVIHGWIKKNDNTYYILDDGSYAKSNFFQLNTQWYYFDADGIMATGLKSINGINYFFSYDGGLKTGLRFINNKPYYFELDGKGAEEGWIEKGSYKYYSLGNGLLAVGINKIGKKEYKFDNKGRLLD